MQGVVKVLVLSLLSFLQHLKKKTKKKTTLEEEEQLASNSPEEPTQLQTGRQAARTEVKAAWVSLATAQTAFLSLGSIPLTYMCIAVGLQGPKSVNMHGVWGPAQHNNKLSAFFCSGFICSRKAGFSFLFKQKLRWGLCAPRLIKLSFLQQQLFYI